MDDSSACGFFDLILGLFVEADVNTNGKLIGKFALLVAIIYVIIANPFAVLDEAHKVSLGDNTGPFTHPENVV